MSLLSSVFLGLGVSGNLKNRFKIFEDSGNTSRTELSVGPLEKMLCHSNVMATNERHRLGLGSQMVTITTFYLCFIAAHLIGMETLTVI